IRIFDSRSPYIFRSVVLDLVRLGYDVARILETAGCKICLGLTNFGFGVGATAAGPVTPFAIIINILHRSWGGNFQKSSRAEAGSTLMVSLWRHHFSPRRCAEGSVAQPRHHRDTQLQASIQSSAHGPGWSGLGPRRGTFSAWQKCCPVQLVQLVQAIP